MQYEIFKTQVIKYLSEQKSHRSEKSELIYQRSERSRDKLLADRLDSEMLRGFCDIWTDRQTNGHLQL